MRAAMVIFLNIQHYNVIIIGYRILFPINIKIFVTKSLAQIQEPWYKNKYTNYGLEINEAKNKYLTHSTPNSIVYPPIANN